MNTIKTILALVAVLSLPAAARDWPQWGGDTCRNMVGTETGLPVSFDPGRKKPDSNEIDLATTRNIKWVARLGTQSYGNVTVANGRIFIGTNGPSPYDPRKLAPGGGVLYVSTQTHLYAIQERPSKRQAR